MAEAMADNDLEQLLTLRRHLLPGEDDSAASLARAQWLFKRSREDLEIVVANAVAKAFGGR